MTMNLIDIQSTADMVSATAGAATKAAPLLELLYNKLRADEGSVRFTLWNEYYEQMLYLRDTYREIYRDAQYSKQIPPCFDAKRCTLIFGMWETIKVPLQIRYNDFSENSFTSHANIDRKRVTNEAINYAIDSGKRYVRKREQSLQRTGTLWGHNMKVPRYYFIYFVCWRLHNLSMSEINVELITEYNYLYNYIKKVQSDTAVYFPKASNDEGFHITLKTLQNSVNEIKKIAITYLNRLPISELLEDLSGTLNSYRRYLAEDFLYYCISNENTSLKVTYTHLSGKSTAMLEEKQKQSPFFQLIHSALTLQSKNLKLKLNKSRLPYPRELTRIEGQFDHQGNICRRDIVIDAYKRLLILLNKFSKKIDIATNITKCCVDFGHQQFINHEDFEGSLEIILETTVLLIQECSQTINTILNTNTLAIKNVTNLSKPGFAENATKAKNTAEHMRYISEHDINSKINLIKARLAEINQHDTPDFISEKNKLRSKCIAMAEEDARDGLPVPPHMLLKLYITAEKKSDNKNQAIKQSYAMPLYQSLKDHPKKIAELNILLYKIETRYKNAKKFASQIRQISEVTQDLNAMIAKALDPLTAPTATTAQHQFQALTKDLRYLIDHCTFNQQNFRSFSQLDTIFEQCNKMEREEVLAIQRLLHQALPDGISNKEKITQVRKLIIKLQLGLQKFREPIKATINEVNTKLLSLYHGSQLKPETHVFNYYHTLLNQHQLSTKTHTTTPAHHKFGYSQHDGGLTTLESIISELKQAQNAHALAEKLTVLYSFLANQSYITHYGGGESIIQSDQKIKIPRHVKKILDAYGKRFHLLNRCDSAQRFIGLQTLRTTILDIAADAAAHPPQYCCGLFRPRNPKTQALYKTLSSVSCTP